MLCAQNLQRLAAAAVLEGEFEVREAAIAVAGVVARTAGRRCAIALRLYAGPEDDRRLRSLVLSGAARCCTPLVPDALTERVLRRALRLGRAAPGRSDPAAPAPRRPAATLKKLACDAAIALWPSNRACRLTRCAFATTSDRVVDDLEPLVLDVRDDGGDDPRLEAWSLRLAWHRAVLDPQNYVAASNGAADR